jgi:26S proteasome regulatory subunit N5
MFCARVQKTEQFVCTLVTTGVISTARIDRLAGVVTFTATRAPLAVLDEWSHDLKQLTDSLNKCVHLITKEEMVHKYLHAIGQCGH